jgi:hypothetical protein
MLPWQEEGSIMSEIPPSDTPAVPEIQVRLQEVARLLRQTGSIDAESKRVLAELVDELSKALTTATVPPAEVTQLAESTVHLAEALHHQQQREVPISVRERLQRAVVNAEAHSPLLVGLARRVLDALADIGI